MELKNTTEIVQALTLLLPRIAPDVNASSVAVGFAGTVAYAEYRSVIADGKTEAEAADALEAYIRGFTKALRAGVNAAIEAE